MSDHLIPDTTCPSCSGTGKVVDLEKELFGDDELVFASSDGEEKEPVLPCSEALEERTSLIQSSGQRSNERESSLEEALELEEALRVRRLDFDAQQSGLQGRESEIRGIRSNLEEVRKLSNALRCI